MSDSVIEQPDQDDVVVVEAADSRQYVTFLVGGEAYAVDMAPVQEIIRVPETVRVPLAPACLVGLANLRGRVLPIVSLRRVFGFPDAASDDATRAVVIDLGQPLGFVVDRVASVIDVDTARIDGVEGIRGTVDSELLAGILKDAGGFAMVMVMDFARLIERQFAGIEALVRAGGPAMPGEAAAAEEDDTVSDELQLVSFIAAGQEYAIEIASVQEIVHLPPQIAHVPNAGMHVLGLMTLRERLLPLLSLRSLFGLPEREPDERTRIVVVSLGAVAVGLVTDSVSEVLRVPLAQVDGVPPLLAGDGELGDVGRICRLDQGKRLVSILSVDHMFQQDAVRDALRAVDDLQEGQTMRTEDDDELDLDEQMVVFRLAEGEFGVPIDSVQEIVRVPDELTHVPKAPGFVEGVINLRGTVLPVIDQRKRLDLPPVPRNDRQRIMVFLIRGARTGFIVDAVTEVLKVPKTAIEPSPRLSGEQAKLLGRVANLGREQRMIQLIDPSFLVDDADQAAMAAISA